MPKLLPHKISERSKDHVCREPVLSNKRNVWKENIINFACELACFIPEMAHTTANPFFTVLPMFRHALDITVYLRLVLLVNLLLCLIPVRFCFHVIYFLANFVQLWLSLFTSRTVNMIDRNVVVRRELCHQFITLLVITWYVRIHWIIES